MTHALGDATAPPAPAATTSCSRRSSAARRPPAGASTADVIEGRPAARHRDGDLRRRRQPARRLRRQRADHELRRWSLAMSLPQHPPRLLAALESAAGRSRLAQPARQPRASPRRHELSSPQAAATFVELTDGGHFENLGLYELVRRRCGLIIVCDGGDDRTPPTPRFTVAARRIEEDFGATFGFDFDVGSGAGFERSGPQHVVARTAADEYPRTPSSPAAATSSPRSATTTARRPRAHGRRMARASAC